MSEGFSPVTIVMSADRTKHMSTVAYEGKRYQILKSLEPKIDDRAISYQKSIVLIHSSIITNVNKNNKIKLRTYLNNFFKLMVRT